MSNLIVRGRQVVIPLTNKSGGSVVAGDVVIADTGNDSAFTTTTTGSYTAGMVGVAQESIANNASGKVCTYGYVALINVNASVTRGHFAITHTVAKQAADGGASRASGTFAEFLTGGTTPIAFLLGVPDGGGGTGAPTTSQYIVGVADGGLSAEKVRTDLYKNYSPDNYPTSGTGAVVDDFDDSSLDAAWTWTSAPTGTADETVYPGFLYISGGTNSSATERILRRTYAPGASTAFSAAMKARVAMENGNFTGEIALHILDSGDAIISGVAIVSDGTTTGSKGHRLFALAGAGTQWGANPIVVPMGGSPAFYLLMTRDASNVYKAYWSLDGMTWQYMGTHTTATTVAKIGIGYQGDTDSVAPAEATIDFVRTFTTVTKKIGA